MFNIIERLKNADVDFLFDDHFSSNNDQREMLKLVRQDKDYIEIYMKILPKIINKISSHVLFDSIYDIDQLKSYTYYLLTYGNISLETLSTIQIKNLIYKTIWGKAFIYHNLEQILSKNSEKKIEIICEYLCEDENSLLHFLEKHLYGLNEKIRILFVKELLLKNVPIFEKNVKLNEIILSDPFKNFSQQSFFSNSNNDKVNICSQEVLAQLLGVLIKVNMSPESITYISNLIINNYPQNDVGKVLIETNDPIIKKYILNNFDIIFNTCNNSKIKMLKRLRNELNENINNKYSFLNTMMDLTNINSDYFNEVLENILKYNLLDTILKLKDKYMSLSINKEFSYVNRGVSTFVFRIGDYVIKLSNYRYCPKCPKHFRVIKNYERKVIHDNSNNPVFYIEIQQYINNKEQNITDQMIYELFKDLQMAGLEITDPKSLNFVNDNFALLESYKDADINKRTSLNTLPDHFKRNPLVLLDIDLLYKINDKNKKYFSGSKYYSGTFNMDESINFFEAAKKLRKIRS